MFTLNTFRLPQQNAGGKFRLVTGGQPKAALFWWLEYNDFPSIGSVLAEPRYHGMGFASGPNDQVVLTTAAKSPRGNQGDAGLWQSQTACIAMRSPYTDARAAVVAQVAVDSFDSDGITFKHLIANDAPYLIHAIVFHGFEVTAKAYQRASGSFAGVQDLTGMGLVPELLFFLLTSSAIANDALGAHADMSFGVAEFSTLSQRALYNRSVTILGPSEFSGGTPDALLTADPASGVYTRQEKIVSSFVDGVEVNWIAADGNARLLNGLAVSGVKQNLRVVRARADLGDIIISGLPFEPEVVLFFSPCFNTGLSANPRWVQVNRESIGAASRKTGTHLVDQQFVSAFTSSQDGLVCSNTYASKQDVWARVKRNDLSTRGRMYLKAFTPDGMKLTMREAEDVTIEATGDAFPSEIYVLALASNQVDIVNDPCALSTQVPVAFGSCPSDQSPQPLVPCV